MGNLGEGFLSPDREVWWNGQRSFVNSLVMRRFLSVFLASSHDRDNCLLNPPRTRRRNKAKSFTCRSLWYKKNVISCCSFSRELRAQSVWFRTCRQQCVTKVRYWATSSRNFSKTLLLFNVPRKHRAGKASARLLKAGRPTLKLYLFADEVVWSTVVAGIRRMSLSRFGGIFQWKYFFLSIFTSSYPAALSSSYLYVLNGLALPLNTGLANTVRVNSTQGTSTQIRRLSMLR